MIHTLLCAGFGVPAEGGPVLHSVDSAAVDDLLPSSWRVPGTDHRYALRVLYRQEQTRLMTKTKHDSSLIPTFCHSLQLQYNSSRTAYFDLGCPIPSGPPQGEADASRAT